MTIKPIFIEFFEKVIFPQIPFGGCALDYDDPDDEEDDGDDDDIEPQTD